MKRVELSDTASSLLVLSSVLVAITPFLLGDRLVLIAGSTLRQGAIMLNELNTYVMGLLS